MRKARIPHNESPRCSFCQKTQGRVAKLISSRSDNSRACICDECISVCAEIMEDDRLQVEAGAPVESVEPHPLLSHPLASQLMECVAQWIQQDSLGVDTAEELGQRRTIATRS